MRILVEPVGEEQEGSSKIRFCDMAPDISRVKGAGLDGYTFAVSLMFVSSGFAVSAVSVFVSVQARRKNKFMLSSIVLFTYYSLKFLFLVKK